MSDRLAKAMHCIHESAHAVVAIELGYRLITISDEPPEVVIQFGPNTWRDELAVLAAGDRAAVKAGQPERASSDDDDARRLLAQVGASPLQLVLAKERAATIVEQRWQQIERLAAALLSRTWLPASEATRIVRMNAPVDEGALLILKLALAARSPALAS